MSRQTARTFDATTYSPRQARRFVGERLNAWGLAGASEAIVLAVSELTTNAVVHGAGPITVTLTATDDRVRVHVENGGAGDPVMRPLDPGRRVDHRWGLRLVDTLADDWGVDLAGPTIGVWFEQRL